MPRVGSAGTVGATIRDSRRNKKTVSHDDGKGGNVNRSGSGRASATKRLSSLQDDSRSSSSRPSSCLFVADSPDLPELLLPGGAVAGSVAGAVGGGGASGSAVGGASGASNTRTGITPDPRAFPNQNQVTNAGTPSLALSPPTPSQQSPTPESEDDIRRTPEAASLNASVDGGVRGRSAGGSVSPCAEGSVDEDAEAYLQKEKVEIVIDMSTTGDWNGLSTLEKPRETDYDRPAPGWKTAAAKTFGFFFFFGLNAFLIAYLVPLVFKAMLGL